eukprot:c15803_g1_i1.p1 GENE.c15803_g1_i1~~c15803_g1_i1.p1  ORF type:complete len:282 (+),score=59.58 c15803_g1_i1:33-878(+)
MQTLTLDQRGGVLVVGLNRPSRKNAMNETMWREIGQLFHSLSSNSSVRCVVLCGEGSAFTSGLDIKDESQSVLFRGSKDTGRRAFQLIQYVSQFQQAFTNIELCPQPVICAVHSVCVGGGVDLASACDIRICSADAKFTIREIDIGMAADIGTLQRFPKIVANQSLVRELAYTGRWFDASEALQMGFVSQILESKESLLDAAISLASTIASKSPLAVAGVKQNLLFSRDHTVAAGLAYVAAWNGGMLQTQDVGQAIQGMLAKRPAEFSNLDTVEDKAKSKL